MQRHAERRLHARVGLRGQRGPVEQLAETEKKINELQAGKSAESALILSPEQKAEIERFLTETRRGLREGDVEYHLVSTSRSPESVLLDLLRGPLRGKVRR